MKVSTILFLTLLISFVSCSKTEKEYTIYLSPEGSDTNNGTIKSPFKTLIRARNEIRVRRTAGDSLAFTVLISGGKYFMPETFILDSVDSGIDGFPVTYEGLKGEEVRFIGGMQINASSFQPLKSGDPNFDRLNPKVHNHIEVLNLNDVGITDPGKLRKRGFGKGNTPSPMELIVNDRTMELARWPDRNYAISSKPAGMDGFVYAGNEEDKWANEKDVWILGYWKYGWAESYNRVKQIDTSENIIKIANKPNDNNSFSTIESGNRNWCGINILAELDTPGEYYIDRENSLLYFYPPQDVDFNDCEIMLSMLGENHEYIFEARGVKNMVFRNLKLEKCRFGALSIDDCKNITIDGCTFRNTGNTAVNIFGENIRFINSEIYDCGAAGINISGGNRSKLTGSHNLIDNCHIYHFGTWNRTYAPGIRISGVGITVSHCTINDAPHAAILFGGNNHLIEKNEFYHTCYETDDAGTIYAGRDWALFGNIIRYNYLHDIKSDVEPGQGNHLGVHGVYIDDCGSGVTVFGNIFDNISGRAVMCGGGRYNKINNNIIMNCGAAHFTDRRGLVWITDVPGDSWNLLEKVKKLNYTEPPFSTAFPNLASLMDSGYMIAKEPVGCEIMNNIGFNNRIWLEENCLGACGGFDFYTIEGNIENADPRFIDETDLLKGLSDDSPVHGIMGFRMIPFSDIGQKGSTGYVWVPEIDGPWWQVAGNPDLGAYTTKKQEPVDFAIWQSADGTWQIWSCIRNTSCGEHTRLFHGWEGQNLADTMWRPLGIVMEADTTLGETSGGLQAPYVFIKDGVYQMFYGDWNNICLATSTDGKHFHRVINEKALLPSFRAYGNHLRSHGTPKRG